MSTDSHMLKALNAGARAICLLLSLWSWLGTTILGTSGESDVYCLKSIKDSLEDPHGYLSLWQFNNQTEGFICGFTGVDCWRQDENKVMQIRLSSMGLKGSFPGGIENCKNLAKLDFSNNKLSGHLPFAIGDQLPLVTFLDLSSNNFSGEIPSSIANCSYLTLLKLAHNNLTGQIPQQLGSLSGLKVFNVANNQLSGQVPDFVSSSLTLESYANNKGLCGGPLKPCKDSEQKYDELFLNGFIVGYVVSVISVMAVFVYSCLRKMHMEKEKKMRVTETTRAIRARKYGRTDKVIQLQPLDLLREQSKEISRLERLVTRMSLTELRKATENFSEDNVIELGMKKTIYGGMLPNGWFLAVKRFHDCPRTEKQFISELKILGTLRQKNIVPLLGFCTERNEKILIYKYIPNGNLYDWLYPVEVSAKTIEWPLRVKIAIGLARGLAWLHYNCKLQVVHLNLSSRCILLDQNFEPNICNFENAMFINPNDTNWSGRNFVDKVTWELGFLKDDVLNFGTVLLELITRKEPSKITSSSKCFNGGLAEWVYHLSSGSSDLYDAFDKSLLEQGFDSEIFLFLKVARNCVHPSPGKRPTMLAVYKTVRVIGVRYGLTDDYELLKQSESAAHDATGESSEIIEVEDES